jgi:hypothetical protein
MQTDVIGVTVGIIGILAGVAASYYFYRKGLHVKSPLWGIQSNNLIRNQTTTLPGLRVLFKEEGVRDLTVSRIVFLNDGQDTIKSSDLETINSLRISAKEGIKLLETKVVLVSNDSNQFSVRETDDKAQAFIRFNYLDNLQGAVIQVIHTGTSSEDIKIEGDIVGVKSISKANFPPFWDPEQNSRRSTIKISPRVRTILRTIGISLGVTVVLFSAELGILFALYDLPFETAMLALALIIFLPSLFIAHRINSTVIPTSTPRSIEDYLPGLHSTDN